LSAASKRSGTRDVSLCSHIHSRLTQTPLLAPRGKPTPTPTDDDDDDDARGFGGGDDDDDDDAPAANKLMLGDEDLDGPEQVRFSRCVVTLRSTHARAMCVQEFAMPAALRPVAPAPVAQKPPAAKRALLVEDVGDDVFSTTTSNAAATASAFDSLDEDDTPYVLCVAIVFLTYTHNAQYSS
jgi:hypothetical protein